MNLNDLNVLHTNHCCSTDTVDRIEEEERAGDREGKETEDGDKLDSTKPQNRGWQLSQGATGNIPTEHTDLGTADAQLPRLSI